MLVLGCFAHFLFGVQQSLQGAQFNGLNANRRDASGVHIGGFDQVVEVFFSGHAGFPFLLTSATSGCRALTLTYSSISPMATTSATGFLWKTRFSMFLSQQTK